RSPSDPKPKIRVRADEPVDVDAVCADTEGGNGGALHLEQPVPERRPDRIGFVAPGAKQTLGPERAQNTVHGCATLGIAAQPGRQFTGIADDESVAMLAQPHRQIGGNPADLLAVNEETPVAREIQRPDHPQSIEKAHVAPSAGALQSPSAMSM